MQRNGREIFEQQHIKPGTKIIKRYSQKRAKPHISSINIIWKDENGKNTEVRQTMEWRSSMSAELHLRKPIHRVLQALLA